MQMLDSIERTLRLPVPIQKAWDAVATPKGISSWFSDAADFEPTVGLDMKLQWGDEIIPTRIEKVDPI